MKNLHLSTYEKIGVVWGIFVILFLSALIVRFLSRPKPSFLPPSSGITKTILSPTIEPLVGQLAITPAQKIVKLGESFEATVFFAAKGKRLDGADAILRFDPNFLGVEGITPGSLYFKEFPRKEFDNQKGLVKVTAFSPTTIQPLSGSVSFFSLTFRTKGEGSTYLSFDFEKGKTSLSTLVESGTSKNILGSVYGATITIEP